MRAIVGQFLAAGAMRQCREVLSSAQYFQLSDIKKSETLPVVYLAMHLASISAKDPSKVFRAVQMATENDW